MTSRLRLIAIQVMTFLNIITDKDMLLWQKFDMLMSRETQGRVMTLLMILVPVLWFFSHPYLALVPIAILVLVFLYYGMFAGGCEAALCDIPFIIAFGTLPFGWQTAAIALVLSWVTLFVGLTMYQQLREQGRM